MHEIRLVVGSRSFIVSVDEQTVSNSKHRRFLVVSYNSYFNYVIGDAVVVIIMTPTPTYSPKQLSLPDAKKHEELLEVIYQALATEIVRR